MGATRKPTGLPTDAPRLESRLATWPPPYRSQNKAPKIIRHNPDEPVKRAKPRGWRLTRAMFSEFEDGD